MFNNIISIDTGNNGGVSIYINGDFFCSPFINIDNAKNFIIEKCGSDLSNFTAVIESLNIFTNVKGSKNTIFKQGIAYGSCIGLLKGLNISNIEEVSAKKWQSYINMPKNIDYKERKKILEEYAESLFPNEMSLKKTKKYKKSICDSLLILEYFLHHRK